jgi:hypothetical protein
MFSEDISFKSWEALKSSNGLETKKLSEALTTQKLQVLKKLRSWEAPGSQEAQKLRSSKFSRSSEDSDSEHTSSDRWDSDS